MATNQLTLFNSSQVWEAREQMDAAGDTWETELYHTALPEKDRICICICCQEYNMGVSKN